MLETLDGSLHEDVFTFAEVLSSKMSLSHRADCGVAFLRCSTSLRRFQWNDFFQTQCLTHERQTVKEQQSKTTRFLLLLHSRSWLVSDMWLCYFAWRKLEKESTLRNKSKFVFNFSSMIVWSIPRVWRCKIIYGQLRQNNDFFSTQSGTFKGPVSYVDHFVVTGERR